MRKVLFHLSISLITFIFGTSSANFLLNEKLESSPINVEEVQNIKIETESQNEHDEYFSGVYEFKNPTHRGMTEVDSISLRRDTVDNNGDKTEKLSLFAEVNTNIERDNLSDRFNSVWAEIKGNEVKFKTYKINGIEYKFNGVFFKNKTSGDDGEEILRGTLQKFIKGKKTAEVTGNFAYRKPSSMICIFDSSIYNTSK